VAIKEAGSLFYEDALLWSSRACSADSAKQASRLHKHSATQKKPGFLEVKKPGG
jgi:hypothetical protein